MSAKDLECQICCEKYTKQQRKVAVCSECEYECCSQCVKTYVLGQSAEPHCMNCFKPFSRAFLKDNLGITFMKTTYKDKKKDLLYEVEKSKMPTTMIAAQRYKKSIRLKEDVKKIIQKREELRQQERLLAIEINKMNGRIWNLERDVSETEQEKKKRHEFIRPCCDENCNGFMSSQWKCGICKKFACSRCHEIIGMRKDDPHVCNEDTVKTVAAIKSDTKPCPKCYSPIFKISGCDQMWCTQCEIAFSWRTGDIQRGNIHNPHFYEARRKLGINTRNPGDVVCGGLVDPWQFRQSFQSFCKPRYFRHYISIQSEMKNIEVLFHLIYAIVHRSTTHNIYVLDRLRQEVRDLQSTERIRVQFIVGERDEATFKKDIYRNNETLIKKRRMCDIFETYINVMIENINAMAVDASSAVSTDDAFKKIMNLYIECEKITKYTECEFLKIGCEYRQATFVFNEGNSELAYRRIPYMNKKGVNWNSLEKMIEEIEKKEYTMEYITELFHKSVVGRYISGYNKDHPGSPKPIKEFVKYIDVGGGGGGGGAAAAK